MCISDSNVERWCEDHFLSLSALQTVDAIRSELTEILKRLELPVSLPAFGSKSNSLNIKHALLAGFFMQVWIYRNHIQNKTFENCKMCFVLEQLSNVQRSESVWNWTRERINLFPKCTVLMYNSGNGCTNSLSDYCIGAVTSVMKAD